ncbi:MAG: DUF3368 domain-containing protein [Phycisphaerales bacterium]
MIVVSDTSPLRALQALDKVAILERMYGSVVIPPAVAAELAYPVDTLGAFNLAAFPSIVVATPHDEAILGALRAQVDEGEAQAIALSLELGADLLVIDDLQGRAAARRAGVRTRGLLGMLVDAKAAGLCGPIRPLVAVLQSTIGFRASPVVLNAVFVEAGEP